MTTLPGRRSNVNAATGKADQTAIDTLSTRVMFARWITLAGYFLLLALILNWFSWLAPPETVPRALPMIVLVAPLMFALRGLLHGRMYTHAWVSLLSMLYFAIGVDVAFNRSDQRYLGLAMVVFSLMLFFGSVVFNHSMKKRNRLTAAGDQANTKTKVDVKANTEVQTEASGR